MLVSPIQSGVNSQAGNSAVINVSPAEAVATGNTVAKASLTEQKKSLEAHHESGSELFAGQLSDALIETGQSDAVQSASEIVDEQAQEPESNAEEWLLAMLDQQQLQLHARDNAMPVNVAAVSQSPADAVAPANSPIANPVIAVEKFPGEKNISSSAINNVAGNVYINPDNGTEKDFNKALELPLKNIVNPSTAITTVNATLAVDTRTSDSNTVLANSSAPAAMNSSVTLVAQQASTTAITEIGHNQLIAPAALNVAADDSVQRGVQTQLSLQTADAKWGEQLLHALRDNVQVQIQQRIQNATIRLDPPELGSLEIYLSHEAGRLNVHITASQSDVARLIQQTSDRLRQELAGPQFTQVNVQTSADGQAGQQQSRERQRMLADDFILQNEQAFVNNDQPANRTSDVLVTV